MQPATIAANASTVEHVWRALEADTRVDARAHPITLAFEDGTLVMEGELSDVAAKTRALLLVQVFPEVRRVVDHLVVEAPVKMPDGEMRDLYRNALLGELAFEDCRLVVAAEGVEDRIRDLLAPRGSLIATIASGVITLEGRVPSLSHARLAGVLAWWIPGTRAVRNELRIDPPEEDNDAELTDAIRIALEAEPLLDADQLTVRTARGRATLSGTLRSEEQRRIAERDAWYVLGVVDVDNRIQLHAS